jgi:membrane protein implicated in regulation of membrane protease activity
MQDSTVWWLLTGTAVAVELATSSFYLLMLAIGLAAGAMAAHVGGAVPTQLVAAAIVGGGAVAGVGL